MDGVRSSDHSKAMGLHPNEIQERDQLWAVRLGKVSGQTVWISISGILGDRVSMGSSPAQPPLEGMGVLPEPGLAKYTFIF